MFIEKESGEGELYGTLAMQENEGSGVALRFGASALVTYGSLGAF